MQLSPIDDAELPAVIDAFARSLSGDAGAAAAFARIAATQALVARGNDLPAHRSRAVALAHAFGIATHDDDPARAYSWDGHAIRVQSEASVIVHEVAHWQLCPPSRRGLPDFGLGAGPETGRREDADAVMAVGAAEKMEEEAQASLLGILWEVELGLPAILAFMEQNWLEGWDRPAARENFVENLRLLAAKGLVGADARPVWSLGDPAALDRLLARTGGDAV